MRHGADSPSPSTVSSTVLPQLPSCRSTGTGMHLHTRTCQGGVSFPLVFCQSSPCLQEQLKVPLVRAAVSGLLAAVGQGRRALRRF